MKYQTNQRLISIDRGEHNLAAAIAPSKNEAQGKPATQHYSKPDNRITKHFPKPLTVMEDLNGIKRKNLKSKELNKRFHSLPFRKLQTIIEYKASLECTLVKYLTNKETKNISKTCHSCGHVTQVKGRIYKCPICKKEYDRDLNACINIAHRVMSSMGWGRCEPPNQHMKR